MPIFEYRCLACGNKFEQLLLANESPHLACPVCNSLKIEKVVSISSFRLKGTGWYQTDFKEHKGEK